jgi:hypothetical protein
MTRPTRLVRALLTGALLTGLAGTTASPASAAVPTTDLVFRDLDRGPAPAVPYLEGDTIVDGTVRIDVPRRVAGLLGTSGGDYLVWAFSRSGSDDTILRIAPDGTREVLVRDRTLYDSHLSPDGDTIAVPVFGNNDRTKVKIYDSGSGALVRVRVVDGFAAVLDYDGSRVAIGVNDPDRTVVWSLADDSVTRVSGDAGYQADLGTDRLAVFTKDPYRGGCTVVSAFSDPDTELWRSCRERVEAWSTDGSRIATVDLLSDGLGPGRVLVRKTGGRLLGQYDAPMYFGFIGFEDTRDVLLDTYSMTKYAVVRCDRQACERAGKVHPHEAPLRALARATESTTGLG